MLNTNIYKFSDHSVKSIDSKKKVKLSLKNTDGKIKELKNRK